MTDMSPGASPLVYCAGAVTSSRRYELDLVGRFKFLEQENEAGRARLGAMKQCNHRQLSSSEDLIDSNTTLSMFMATPSAEPSSKPLRCEGLTSSEVADGLSRAAHTVRRTV
jgi:hypothetical protein